MLRSLGAITLKERDGSLLPLPSLQTQDGVGSYRGHISHGELDPTESCSKSLARLVPQQMSSFTGGTVRKIRAEQMN